MTSQDIQARIDNLVREAGEAEEKLLAGLEGRLDLADTELPDLAQRRDSARGLIGRLEAQHADAVAREVAAAKELAREAALERLEELEEDFKATTKRMAARVGAVASFLSTEVDRLAPLRARLAELHQEYRGTHRAAHGRPVGPGEGLPNLELLLPEDAIRAPDLHEAFRHAHLILWLLLNDKLGGSQGLAFVSSALLSREAARAHYSQGRETRQEPNSPTFDIEGEEGLGADIARMQLGVAARATPESEAEPSGLAEQIAEAHNRSRY